jgi:hypothetical protein
MHVAIGRLRSHGHEAFIWVVQLRKHGFAKVTLALLRIIDVGSDVSPQCNFFDIGIEGRAFRTDAPAQRGLCGIARADVEDLSRLFLQPAWDCIRAGSRHARFRCRESVPTAAWNPNLGVIHSEVLVSRPVDGAGHGLVCYQQRQYTCRNRYRASMVAMQRDRLYINALGSSNDHLPCLVVAYRANCFIQAGKSTRLWGLSRNRSR